VAVPPFCSNVGATPRCERVERPSMKCLATPCNSVVYGGEGGIRTQQDSLNSVSYRFHNARVADNAGVAVAPCTPLHARRRFRPPRGRSLTGVVRATNPSNAGSDRSVHCPSCSTGESVARRLGALGTTPATLMGAESLVQGGEQCARASALARRCMIGFLCESCAVYISSCHRYASNGADWTTQGRPP
jgi:hypothetical protein